MNLFNNLIVLSSTISISAPLFAAEYLSEAQAKKVLFPSADSFSKVDVTLNDDQLDKIKKLSGVRQRNNKPLVWKAEVKKKTVGYFYIDEVIGKHEYITYALAVTPEGETLGVEIMSYRETHGGEIKELSWRKKLTGKKITDPFKLDVDVPNISGATLSCRNVLDGVKRLLVLQQIINNG